MIAYAGTYTLEDDKVTHHVDISWNEARTGNDDVRFYKHEGNILTITALVPMSQTGPGINRDGRGVRAFYGEVAQLIVSWTNSS